MSERFRRDRVKPGDALVFTRNESIRFVFKGMAHEGEVIATYVEPPPGRPADIIGLQRDFRIPGPSAVLECPTRRA